MARSKATTAALVARQTGLDPDHPAIDSQIEKLDRQAEKRQREQADEVAQLKEAWGPKVAQAQRLISQIESLEAEFGPVVDDLAERTYEGVPRSLATLNAMATIERLSTEIQHLLHHPHQDLEALITAVERLTPATLPTFIARTDEYHQQLRIYTHTPQGIRDLFKNLMHSVESLTARLEAIGREDVVMPLRRISEPQPETPEVEMN